MLTIQSFNIPLPLFFFSPSESSRDKNRTSGRLNNGIPQVPQKRGPSELDFFRRSLPVYERQEEIVQVIKDNRVVLVVGETGSGKTTQVRGRNILHHCPHKVP